MAIASLLSLRLRTLYLNRYLRVLPLLSCSSLYRRYRLVSFHICKASRRSSKFCPPVADLYLSSFFLPRPPSTNPALLSFPFFLPVFLPRRLVPELTSSTSRSRSHLRACPPSDLWVAENWPKRSRKSPEGGPRPAPSSISSSALSASSLFLSFLHFAPISCACVQRAPTAST